MSFSVVLVSCCDLLGVGADLHCYVLCCVVVYCLAVLSCLCCVVFCVVVCLWCGVLLCWCCVGVVLVLW